MVSYRRAEGRDADRAQLWSRRSGNAGHCGPGLESSGPCGAILGGEEVATAEVEEVADLVVGGEETLGMVG